MNNLKVTIVSITYNHENFIREALDSFVKQKTNFSYNILIGDDASSDNTATIIDNYAKEYPHLITPILRKKNVGLHKNLYDLLTRVTSEYIVFCEGDDFLISQDKLQKQVDFLDQNTDYSLCFHPVKVFFEDKHKEEYLFPNNMSLDQFTVNNLICANFIQTNSVMWRRQSYENMPTEVMPLDWYLHLYHSRYGKIGFLPEVMAAYRRHNEGIWSEKNWEELTKKYAFGLLQMPYEVLKLYPDIKEKSLFSYLLFLDEQAEKYLSSDEFNFIQEKLKKLYPKSFKQNKIRKRKKKIKRFFRKIEKFFGF